MESFKMSNFCCQIIGSLENICRNSTEFPYTLPQVSPNSNSRKHAAVTKPGGGRRCSSETHPQTLSASAWGCSPDLLLALSCFICWSPPPWDSALVSVPPWPWRRWRPVWCLSICIIRYCLLTRLRLCIWGRSTPEALCPSVPSARGTWYPHRHLIGR